MYRYVEKVTFHISFSCYVQYNVCYKNFPIKVKKSSENYTEGNFIRIIYWLCFLY